MAVADESCFVVSFPGQRILHHTNESVTQLRLEVLLCLNLVKILKQLLIIGISQEDSKITFH